MRAVWVDDRQDLDLRKVNRYGIQDPYFAAVDPRLNPQPGQAHFLDVVAGLVPGRPGVYFAWNWYPQQPPAQLAKTVSDELIRIGWRGNPAVCIDIEKGHGLNDQNYVTYVVEFLKAWRKFRPTRKTDWTLEGFQGGLFNNRYADVQKIVAANVGVIPQFYHGDMTPHQAGAIQDLTDYGFPRDRVHGFYDGRLLQEPWDGFVFTQGRLP